MYHYAESGLDYVYLVNGYQEEDTPYGTAISIDNPTALHRLLGSSIARSPMEMTPSEFRFLRIEMDLSQKDLAGWMRVDAQTVARWEKGETSIPGPAERLMKGIYLDFISENSNLRDMCERLAELDQPDPHQSVRLEEINGEWRIAA